MNNFAWLNILSQPTHLDCNSIHIFLGCAPVFDKELHLNVHIVAFWNFKKYLSSNLLYDYKLDNTHVKFSWAHVKFC